MSNFKIQDVYQRKQYSATSGQTAFSVPFPFFENSDLTVWKNNTKLTITTNYTVSGAGSPSGGTVTLTSGATAGDIITIQGLMPIDRTSLYSNTVSNLTGTDLNNDFNRDIVMLKQLETTQEILQLQYKPYAEVSQDVNVTRDRWLPILGPNQVWAMNSAGTEIEALDFDNAADAPSDAYYYLGTADGQLPNGKDLSALANGLLKHSVSGGISTPARAIPATDYWAPGNDLTTPNPPSNGDDVTNKTYVDALAAGATWFNSVRVATTGNLSATYNNGSSGVGATLTASSNGAASIDGVSLSLNDRVLFKDQSNAFENGIYYVSQVGDASNPAIYTRATDYDQSAEIDAGDIMPAREGTANNDTFWVQTSDVNTIGTDSIDFALFGNNPSNVVTISGAQTITGDKTFTGTTIVPTPSGGTEAANKNYVDNSIATDSDFVLLDAVNITTATPFYDYVGMTTDFFEYYIDIYEARPVTNGTSLQMRLSTDNGATFITTASYTYRISYFQGAATLNNGSTSATAFAYTVAGSNVSGGGSKGYIKLLYPSASGLATSSNGHLQYTDSSSVYTNSLPVTKFNTGVSHNAFRIKFGTGDIASLVARVYGKRAN